MSIVGPAQRLTIYLGDSDTWQGRNLAVEIVERCRRLGLAGATVCRGIMGFGRHSRLHGAHLLGLSQDLPERIEIIDRPERIALLLPQLDEILGDGLVVLQDIQVVGHPVHAAHEDLVPSQAKELLLHVRCGQVPDRRRFVSAMIDRRPRSARTTR